MIRAGFSLKPTEGDHGLRVYYVRSRALPQNMQIRKSGVVVIALAVLSAVVAGLSTGEAWTIIERFVVTFVFGALGLFMAESSRIKGSRIVASDDTAATIKDVIVVGLLPGLLLGLVNYFFFFSYRYSPYVLPRIRNIGSVYDAFILSTEIALTEEIIYRLFFLSCILYTAKYLYGRRAPDGPFRSSTAPLAVALVGSSLIFAFAHRSPYSFAAAFLGGIVLGVIYLRKGVEPSIAAHFAANFLFFSASYLYRP